MDEPLSNLDAKLRVQMRAELLSLHRRLGITTLYVTHDQTEAMTLGDRVVVMRDGVVQQVDVPERVYQDPQNTFVAGFIGSPAMNFLEGNLTGGSVQIGTSTFDLSEAQRARLTISEGPVLVGTRPEAFEVTSAEAPGTFRAAVEITEQLGPETLAYLRLDGVTVARVDGHADDVDDSLELGGTVVARFDPTVGMRAGDRLQVRVKDSGLRLFDRESGQSLLTPA
jgi:multiple sugar transport system ATP-binding protein